MPDYQTDQPFAGISATLDAMATDSKKAKALRQALKLYAPDMGDRADAMGLPELEGTMHGLALKSAQAAQAQQAQTRAAQLKLYETQTANQVQQMDAVKALQSLGIDAGQMMSQPGPSALAPGDPEAQMDPSEAAAPADFQAALPGLLARHGAAFAAPQFDNSIQAMLKTYAPKRGEEMPAGWTSPSGNPYVRYHNTLLPDRTAVDTSEINTPEGYDAVPDGKGGVKYVKLPTTPALKLPESFHKTMDDISQDVAASQSRLEMSDADFKADPIFKDQDPASIRAAAKRNLARAQARGKMTLQRYSRYLQPDELDAAHAELGLPAPKGGSAAAVEPLPKSKTDLVKGKRYQTARGPAVWDGKQFMPE
jgi:hypothetical protein